LLDSHFECRRSLWTVYCNTGDLNVQSYTWIYWDSREVAGIDVRFMPFGIVCFVWKQIMWARGDPVE
jgi:hypothetical protein